MNQRREPVAVDLHIHEIGVILKQQNIQIPLKHYPKIPETWTTKSLKSDISKSPNIQNMYYDLKMKSTFLQILTNVAMM